MCAPVGLEYLEYVIKNIHIPYVAIGGIKEHNLHEVLSKGLNVFLWLQGYRSGRY